MAVYLSPVGGVAAQFFDNDGNVLSGGKIYTYLAGTSTPVATYTTSAGVISHSNPIILDSAGRVPTGEIWLTDGINYKFVLNNSIGTLIGTYDNITGINSNFTNFLANQEIFTATANQTVFTLANAYTPNANTLSVFVDGVNQYGPGAQYAYLETNANTVTFVSGLHVGASVKFTTVQSLTSTQATTAALVSYTPAGTGAVTTTVQAKLRQTISVFDFLSASDITTVQSGSNTNNIASKIQAAIDYASSLTGATIFFPTGCYYIGTANPAISIPSNVHLQGDATSYRGTGAVTQGTEFLYNGTGTAIYAQGMFIECADFSVRVITPSGSTQIGILHDGGWFGTYKRLTFKNFLTANGFGFKMTSGPVAYGSYACCLDQIDAQSSALAFFGRNSGDGITTLTLKDVQGERMSASNAQIVLLNGSFTVSTGTAVYLGASAYLTMLGVDIEGSGDYGILVDDATASLVETGTIWLGWSGTRRVFNNGGTIQARSYGPVSVQQTFVANTAIKVSEFGGQAASNGVLQNFVSEFVLPTNVVGGTQDAYRQWYRWNSGANILDHDWQQHAFVKKAISTSATSAVTIFTIPIPSGAGLRLSAHANGSQAGDSPYSNYRDCVVMNNAGTLTITQGTQQTAGSTGAITFVASSANVLVQWTPTTVNASTGTMNLEIRGPWTSYS
jgi:hypothetical protein